MEKTGTYQFTTESYLLDFQGKVTIPMIGNYLLHVAGEHAGERGFGFEYMQKHRCTWVLSRLAIEMFAYPKMSQPITVRTWVEDAARFFTNRCFEILDKDGKPIGYARSVWAAIHLDTRKPIDLSALGELKDYTVELPCPIEKPGKIHPAEDKDEAGESYTVKYSDLDINGHLNSIKYMEHLLDLFGIDLYKEKEIRRFEIAYQSEGKYGMTLSLHKKETAPGIYNLSICDGEGKAICRAAVAWR